MKLVRGLLLVLILPMMLAGCQKPPETAESILQKIVAAHGSEADMKQVEGFLYYGEVTSLLDKDDKGKVWILYRFPQKLRVVVELENRRDERLYLHGKGWVDNGDGFVEATGATLDLMKFQAEHLALPFDLRHGKYRARLLEKKDPDDPVKLELTDANGVITTISVDPFRWVIRTAEREFEVNGKKLVAGIVFEEYRTIKGIQLPYRILNFINGTPVGQTEFSSVQTNPSVPEKIFSAPGNGAG